MSVDSYKLVIVVRVRVSAQRAISIGAGVGKVVHAGIERRGTGRLMVQAECMTDLLTHHVEFLIRIVISRSVEVGIIHLGRALRDVRTF